MNWKEAIKYCEEHHCEDCPAYYKTDCRTELEKESMHFPCCINLVAENLRSKIYETVL